MYNKLSSTDTSNEEAESRTWFWNESANETDSDSEKEGSSDVDEEELEEEQSRTEQAVSPKLCKIDVKWSKEGEQNLRGWYGKGSKSSQMRRNRSIRELEKEGLKTYNIQALWQRSQDLAIISQNNGQVGAACRITAK